MTPQQFVGLAVRIFSLWLLASAIGLAGFGISLNQQPTLAHSFAPFVLAMVLLALALLLWLFPMVVAHNLVPKTHFDDVLPFPGRETAAVACLVLGLWVLVDLALPPLAQFLSIAAIVVSSGETLRSVPTSYIARLVEGFVELGAGFVLVFRAKQIAVRLIGKPANLAESEPF